MTRNGINIINVTRDRWDEADEGGVQVGNASNAYNYVGTTKYHISNDSSVFPH